MCLNVPGSKGRQEDVFHQIRRGPAAMRARVSVAKNCLDACNAFATWRGAMIEADVNLASEMPTGARAHGYRVIMQGVAMQPPHADGLLSPRQKSSQRSSQLSPQPMVPASQLCQQVTSRVFSLTCSLEYRGGTAYIQNHLQRISGAVMNGSHQLDFYWSGRGDLNARPPCAQGGFRRPSKIIHFQLLLFQTDVAKLLRRVECCGTGRILAATISSSARFQIE